MKIDIHKGDRSRVRKIDRMIFERMSANMFRKVRQLGELYLRFGKMLILLVLHNPEYIHNLSKNCFIFQIAI